MELSIQQFRQELFAAAAKALSGEPVVVTHQGNCFIFQAEAPVDRLARLTPLEVIDTSCSETAENAWKAGMAKDWEHDWQDL